MLADSGPPLLLYLGWSLARVNYRGAPESCVTKDGRQNIVILPCPIQEKTSVRAQLFRQPFSSVVSFTYDHCDCDVYKYSKSEKSKTH